MRNLTNPVMVPILLCLITVWHSQAFGQVAEGVSETEKKVWKMEGAYWNYLKEGKFEEFKNLFHKDFWGWPANSPIPINRSSGIDLVKKGFEMMKEGSLAYALIKKKINIVGNVSIVYYSCAFAAESKDGAGISNTSRITHIWLKQPDEKWKLIGGNSWAMPAFSGNESLVIGSQH